jgi:hypothetical protein
LKALTIWKFFREKFTAHFVALFDAYPKRIVVRQLGLSVPLETRQYCHIVYAHCDQVSLVLAQILATYDYLCARVAFFRRYARHQWLWYSLNYFIFLIYSKISKLTSFEFLFSTDKKNNNNNKINNFLIF